MKPIKAVEGPKSEMLRMGKLRVNLSQQRTNSLTSTPWFTCRHAQASRRVGWLSWGPEPHSGSLATSSRSVWCRIVRKPSPRFTKPAFVFDTHFPSHPTNHNYASPTCHFNTCSLRSYQSITSCLYSHNYEHKPYLHPPHTTHHVFAVLLYPK